MQEFVRILADTPRLAKAIESFSPNPKQKEELRALYASTDGIQISRDKGRRVRGDTIHLCSKIGTDLAKCFDGIGPKDKMMWIGFLEPDGEHEKWVMRPEVKSAIKSLGWF